MDSKSEEKASTRTNFPLILFREGFDVLPRFKDPHVIRGGQRMMHEDGQGDLSGSTKPSFPDQIKTELFRVPEKNNVAEGVINFHRGKMQISAR